MQGSVCIGRLLEQAPVALGPVKSSIICAPDQEPARLYGLVSPGAACLTLACCISERRAFVRMSGISDDDVLLAETVARPFKPVWWICHDRATSAIMVAVRGTFSMSDVLSDVLATQVLYKEHVIHEGVLASARWVYSKVAPVLRREMASEGGKILITGHSLGGAVAALLAWLLREDAGLPARAFVFGVPQVTDEALARKMAKFVTGIIHARDIIPMLSQKSVEDLRHQVAEAAQTPEEKLLELQAVLANFHLPTEPALLQDALSQRQFQASWSAQGCIGFSWTWQGANANRSKLKLMQNSH